jgi:hypothetical protein
MAEYSDPRDYRGEVRKRNELRREARLPLLDEAAEIARLRQLDLDTAYANFFAHMMVPHNVRWERPPSSWSESMARIGLQRRAEERIKPEVEQKWEEIVRAGRWSEWLKRSDARPLSTTVWASSE